MKRNTTKSRHLDSAIDNMHIYAYNVCMGTKHEILNFGGISVCIIDTNDHNPPHVHCYKAGASAKIRIKDGKIMAENKRFTRKSLERLSNFVFKNQVLLLEKWEEFYGQENN
jgi:hypothetical protein